MVSQVFIHSLHQDFQRLVLVPAAVMVEVKVYVFYLLLQLRLVNLPHILSCYFHFLSDTFISQQIDTENGAVGTDYV